MVVCVVSIIPLLVSASPVLPLDTRQSGSILGQRSSVIIANCLLFSGLAELSVLNARFSPPYSVEGIPLFFYTKNIEIIALDEFC
jgi:hypothetical protein